jgi:hypothetical protein
MVYTLVSVQSVSFSAPRNRHGQYLQLRSEKSSDCRELTADQTDLVLLLSSSLTAAEPREARLRDDGKMFTRVEVKKDCPAWWRKVVGRSSVLKGFAAEAMSLTIS